VSVLGRKRPETLIFNTFEDWHNSYFKHLPEAQKEKQVIEIPLKPELLYEQTSRYIEAGIKQFIWRWSSPKKKGWSTGHRPPC
jgi:hypothetical protein